MNFVYMGYLGFRYNAEYIAILTKLYSARKLSDFCDYLQ